MLIQLVAFGVWCALSAVMTYSDPWENQIHPSDKRTETNALMGMARVRESLQDIADIFKFAQQMGGSKTAHATSSSTIDALIAEKHGKLKVVVPGLRPPGLLKLQLGLSLVMFMLTLSEAISGTSDLNVGHSMLAAGFWMLLTILTTALYLNTTLPFYWTQKFLRSTLSPAIYPIVGMLALAITTATLLSQQGQRELVETIHATTDSWLGVPEEYNLGECE